MLNNGKVTNVDGMFTSYTSITQILLLCIFKYILYFLEAKSDLE